MLTAALPLALVAPAGAAAQTDGAPVEAASDWLSEQLVDGAYIETTLEGDDFPDHGLTADVVLALAGAQTPADELAGPVDWLEDQAGAYTGTDSDAVYPGSVVKLLLVLEATGRPTTTGDQDLIGLLEGREQGSGRFTDEGEFGDNSNAITQSLAVLALDRVDGTEPSDQAVDYLLAQSCDDGSFPQQLSDSDAGSSDSSGGGSDGGCEGQVDATGFAAQALAAVGEEEAVADAAAWLVEQQGGDGGFVGTEGSVNANSTGLAAVALHLAGEGAAVEQARGLLRQLQGGCADVDPGAICYDVEGGGDPVRATAQGLLGLTGTTLTEVSATGEGGAAAGSGGTSGGGPFGALAQLLAWVLELFGGGETQAGASQGAGVGAPAAGGPADRASPGAGAGAHAARGPLERATVEGA